MEFWVISTIDNEYSSSYKYITTTLKDAKKHRMEYCGWYCHPGDVDLIKINQNFVEVERIHYRQGKVWEHTIRVFDDKGVFVDEKYLVKKGKEI